MTSLGAALARHDCWRASCPATIPVALGLVLASSAAWASTDPPVPPVSTLTRTPALAAAPRAAAARLTVQSAYRS